MIQGSPVASKEVNSLRTEKNDDGLTGDAISGRVHQPGDNTGSIMDAETQPLDTEVGVEVETTAPQDEIDLGLALPVEEEENKPEPKLRPRVRPRRKK